MLDLFVRISSLARERILGGCTIWVDLVSSLCLGFKLYLVNPQTEVVPQFCIAYSWTVCLSFGLVLGLVGVWYIVDICFY